MNDSQKGKEEGEKEGRREKRKERRKWEGGSVSLYFTLLATTVSEMGNYENE